MKVDVSSVGSHQKKLRFTVPAIDVRRELDTAFRQLGKRVRLRGFRPGKAPRNVLEARFGDQIRSDVANALIQDSLSSALRDHEIDPVGRPQLDDSGPLAASDDFEFTVTIDVKPEIELQTYDGIRVVYPTVEVTDEEVESAVRARLEGQARLVQVSDRPAEQGDMVLVELTLKERDGEGEVLHEPGTMIRTEADPYFPGLEPLLLGMQIDEEKTGEVTIAEDARTEHLRGKDLVATVKVQSIQANEVPELTDELAEELGYEGGAQGMRDAIRLHLSERRNELARNQARANLLEAIIEANPFDVPNGMIDSALDMLTEELRMQQGWRTGRDPRTVTFSEAQLADLRKRAAFAAKAGVLLEHVASKERLEVTEADLEAKYGELAELRGQTIEAVKGYFVKEGAIDELRDRLLEEKTLDWLLERAEMVAPGEGEPATPEQRGAMGTLAEQIIDEQVSKKLASRKKAPKAEQAAEPEAGEAG